MGITRLSLGIENFEDHILEINGRPLYSNTQIRIRRPIGFQINVDLIAGMLERPRELAAESHVR